MAKTQHEIMTVEKLIALLNRLVANKQIKKDAEISMSSDEEGNSFCSMLADPACSIGIEDCKNITFYPSHI